MKHKTSYSQEESKQNQFMPPEDLGTDINLGLNDNKCQSLTGVCNRLYNVLAKFWFPLQGII